MISKAMPTIIRAMDNIIDRTVYPLPEQEVEAKNKRRMGIGITGLANALEIAGMPYGSPEAYEATKWIMTVLRNSAYRASIELAKEKGAFELFDVAYLDSEFALTLPDDIREDIRQFGIRNSHLLSIAPTGTISLCANNISSGLEPVFAHEFERVIQSFDSYRKEIVRDYAYEFYGVKGVKAAELHPMEHVKMLNLISGYVDSACSKTINCDKSLSWEEFKNLYIEAWKGGASGCTTFNSDGLRFGILNDTSINEDSNKDEEEGACTWDPATGKKTCE